MYKSRTAFLRADVTHVSKSILVFAMCTRLVQHWQTIQSRSTKKAQKSDMIITNRNS